MNRLSLVIGAACCCVGLSTHAAMNVAVTAPRRAEVNVPNRMPVTVTFSQNVDSVTVTTNSFIVRGERRASYPGTYSVATNRIVFTPSAAYRPGDRVTVQMTAAISSTVAQALTPYTFQFIARAAGCGHAQFGFTTNGSLGTTGHTAVAFADIDGDGDQDAVTAGSGSNVVYLGNGAGAFTTNGALGPGGMTAVALGDLDGDGDMDAVFAGPTSDPIFLNNGDGTFTTNGALIVGPCAGVALGDVDRDGDLDAVFACSGPNSICLNNGSGTFTTNGALIGTNNVGVALGDLDGDGDLDAMFARRTTCIIHFNTGSGTFTTNGTLGRTNNLGIALGDLDGDGDLDAVVANKSSNTVYANTGNGVFTTNTWLNRTNCTGVTLGDLDGDGDLDILASHVGPGAVYLNNGAATFTTNQLLGATNLLGVALGDLDGDGDLDGFFSVNGANTIHLNTGTCFFVTNSTPANAAKDQARDTALTIQFSAAQSNATVTTTTYRAWGRQSGLHAGTYTYGTSSAVLDPTNDFKPGEDVVVMVNTNAKAATGQPARHHTFQFHTKVSDCALDGSVFTGTNMLLGKIQAAFGGRIADLNGDGWLDAIAVMSFDSNHILYANSGNGTFTTNLLTITSDANDVDVGDVNGDGKPDLVIANYAPELLQVCTNNGSGSFRTNQVLGPVAIRFGVRLGDLDGDGDLDIFATGFGASDAVYLNGGSGLFVTNQLLSTNDGFSVDLGDLDSDGDLDAFVTCARNGKDLVYINDGKGNFTTNQITSAADMTHVRLGDLDNDGDLDAFAASEAITNEHRVFINNGDATFTTNLVANNNSRGDGLALGDLDGDGDLDAYVGGLNTNDVVYLNDGNALFSVHQSLGPGQTRCTDLGDLDNDGDLDAFNFSTGALPCTVWFNEPPPPTVAPVFLSPGSPVVTANPAPSQNNVGDNFDFVTAGGAAINVDRCGFGDFGQVYFNYDQTNLYVGAYGIDLGGTNNGLVLFLGFNTVTNDRTNLIVQTGNPQALDGMHNLQFFPPMDVAVVLGDESADTNAPSFSLVGGQNLGQGAFYVGVSTFPVVTNAQVSQFDGTGTTATASADDDGNRVTDRWEARIPWSNLNASGPGSVTSFYVAGVLVGSTNGNSRYLSSNYIGTNATHAGAGDASGNYAYSTVTVYGISLVMPSLDSDGDGMPNYFELGNGLNPTNAADASSDNDGDDYYNVEEYVAGTQLTNGNSFFTVGNTSAAPRGVQFNSLTGRLYTVEYRDNLVNLPDWQVLSNNVAGTGGSVTVADPTTTNARNYRLRVKMGP